MPKNDWLGMSYFASSPRVRALVRARELAAPVLLRTRDPAEAGVVALRPPLLRLRQGLLLALAVDLLEQPDVVVTFAPHERLVVGVLALGVGVEEGRDLLGEVLERYVGHEIPLCENLTHRSS